MHTETISFYSLLADFNKSNTYTLMRPFWKKINGHYVLTRRNFFNIRSGSSPFFSVNFGTIITCFFLYNSGWIWMVWLNLNPYFWCSDSLGNLSKIWSGSELFQNPKRDLTKNLDPDKELKVCIRKQFPFSASL